MGQQYCTLELHPKQPSLPSMYKKNGGVIGCDFIQSSKLSHFFESTETDLLELSVRSSVSM